MIVALNKTLARIKPEYFGWVYIGVFCAFFVFLCRIKPFNYNRFCLWEQIQTLAVIWITTLSAVHAYLDNAAYNPFFTIALFAGWILLAIVGYYIQTKYRDSTYPSLLFFHKSENYAHMIRF